MLRSCYRQKKIRCRARSKWKTNFECGNVSISGVLKLFDVDDDCDDSEGSGEEEGSTGRKGDCE